MLDLLKQFFENEEATTHRKAALNALAKYSENNSDFRQMSVNDFQRLFDTFRSSNESVVRRYVLHIREFLTWANADESLKALESFVETNKRKSLSFDQNLFFGEYKSLIDEFESYATRHGFPDQQKFLALITLAWFGVPKEAIGGIEFSQITVNNGVFEIKDLVKIRNPRAVAILSEYQTASGYAIKSGGFRSYKPSRFLFRGGSGVAIGRRLTELCRKAGDNGKFTYENIAQSAVYAKAYNGIQMLGIPIVEHPQGTHRTMIAHLLELPEAYWIAFEFKVKYLPFYEWCKAFRRVDD